MQRLKRIFIGLRTGENFNILIYLGSSVFSALAGLVMLRFFTKYLGPEDIGIFGYVTTVNAFLIPLFTLNLNSFYIKKAYEKQLSSIQVKELLGTVTIFIFLWTILLIVILGATGAFIFEAGNVKFNFYPFMFFTILSNLFLGATSLIILQYRILSQAWNYFIFSAVQTVCLIGCSYAFVGIIHWGIYGRIYGTLIGSVVVGIVSILLLRKHVKCVVRKDFIVEGLKFSLPLVPYTMVVLLFDMLDRIFLVRYSATMANTGIYNIGAQFAMIISMLSLAIYRAYEPLIFKMVTENREKEMTSKMIMLNNFMLVTCILFILFSSGIMRYLTNGRFNTSILIAVLLVIAFYFKAAYFIMNTVLASFSKTKEIMFFSLIGLAIIVISSILLVPVYNSVGTACIKIGLYLIMCVGSFFLLKKNMLYKRFITHTMLTGIGLMLFVFFLLKIGYFHG